MEHLCGRTDAGDHLSTCRRGAHCTCMDTRQYKYGCDSHHADHRREATLVSALEGSGSLFQRLRSYQLEGPSSVVPSISTATGLCCPGRVRRVQLPDLPDAVVELARAVRLDLEGNRQLERGVSAASFGGPPMTNAFASRPLHQQHQGLGFAPLSSVMSVQVNTVLAGWVLRGSSGAPRGPS
jgi:hypothetical protein